MAKAEGSIDKMDSFPEWQYKVTTILESYNDFLFSVQGSKMSNVLLLKSDLENKFKLNQLLSPNFTVKIVKNNLISDIIHPKTNIQFEIDTETTIKAGQILLISMNDPKIVELSVKSLDFGFKMKMYRDRFDLADLITKSIETNNSKGAPCDPLHLISLMTWESSPLPLKECELVLNHFKDIENMFKLSKEALEFSLNSLEISEKSKLHIKTFMTSDQDYYIDY